MPSSRSRRPDDDDDDDRPRRGRRDDDDDDDERPRRKRRDDDDDEARSRRRRDDDDERPRKRRRREEDETPSGGKTGIVIGAVIGLVVVIGVVVAVVATRKPRNSTDTPTNNTPGDITTPPGFRPPVSGPTPTVDAEGLPIGNDLDSVLVRLKHRFQQNDFFRYQLETENLRFLNKPDLTRRVEVFRILRTHAGAPTTQPQVGTIPFLAWQRAMDWTKKDDVPELSKMLTAEKVEQRQSDLFGKLAAFKDPRCAEAVAPFLASQERRNAAETMLKELDSSIEPFVLPYLGATNAKETRVAALQVVSAVGTKESVKLVEPMTRDPDLQVSHHAKIVFEKMSKNFGVEMDLAAVVKALKDGIAAQNAGAINDAYQQLTKAYRADHPKRADVFKGLLDCCAVNDPKGFGKLAAIGGALKWSSKDDVEAINGLLVSTGGESVVFLKLKEYKDPKSADVVASFLAVPLKMNEAVAVLKEIGTGAEKSVQPFASRAAPNGVAIPFATRLAAIELLGDIGTGNSVGGLKQLAADPMVQAAANKSLMKILARLK
ncbi:MAG: hypothetical protein K8U57_33530 [Planctomycetes bacterium]|nr:hypothetical protein [Planctomycetota bacterium]